MDFFYSEDISSMFFPAGIISLLVLTYEEGPGSEVVALW